MGVKEGGNDRKVKEIASFKDVGYSDRRSETMQGHKEGDKVMQSHGGVKIRSAIQ